MQKILFPLLFLFLLQMKGQNNEQTLPYSKIPEYPEKYTAGTVVSRMIDGLGFRYYWATEGLLEKDLAYKPSDSNRTISETIDHIHGLSRVIYNSAVKQINERGVEADSLSFEEKRVQTLLNLKRASEIFLTCEDLSEHKLRFKNKDNVSEYPFWNQINGPLEDAVWHCGQIVAMRRASGNPFDQGVSVFRGAKRDNAGG